MHLTNDERETHINQMASDRSKWILFTDDPVMIRKLDKIATGKKVGLGKEYTLEKGQISIRKKRKLSKEAKEKLANNLQSNLS